MCEKEADTEDLTKTIFEKGQENLAFRNSPFTPLTQLSSAMTIFASLLPRVLAQAPANDEGSWPSGILLLATILYAALGTSPDLLWEMEPVNGFFLFKGLPTISLPTMRRVNWVTNACHFIPDIRSAFGRSNFWYRSNEVSVDARAEALEKALSHLKCVTYRPAKTPLDNEMWALGHEGILKKATSLPSSPSYEIKCPPPNARDFLLFAAIDYHAFREWEVQIYSKGSVVLSTKNMPPSSIIDVNNEEEAVQIVAAQMVRRPHSQSPLRALAVNISKTEDEFGPYVLDLDSINRDTPVCAIDFHSYAPESHKVSATLSELGRSYLRVVNYLKNNSPRNIGLSGQIARIEVGQTLWISILGGAIFDTGRLTIQNLPGRWGSRNISADDAYLSRLDTVLQQLAPYGGTATEFGDLVYSGGISRRSAIPFFIAGLIGQAAVCYLLSAGTSAGVWTSVALANALYAGRLTDWHTIFFGKRGDNSQPGMKMLVPGSPRKELMMIATFDRSVPQEGNLRPGFFMNSVGLIAAVLGAAFQDETRIALNFGPSPHTPPWVIYTTVSLCVATTLLVLSMLVVQQSHEKTWRQDSEFPTRWMAYATFPCSLAVSFLALLFHANGRDYLWPILDAITFLSGVPLAMIENGRMFAADDNILHLVLLNRWMMGAVASSLGST